MTNGEIQIITVNALVKIEKPRVLCMVNENLFSRRSRMAVKSPIANRTANVVVIIPGAGPSEKPRSKRLRKPEINETSATIVALAPMTNMIRSLINARLLRQE